MSLNSGIALACIVLAVLTLGYLWVAGDWDSDS